MVNHGDLLLVVVAPLLFLPGNGRAADRAGFDIRITNAVTPLCRLPADQQLTSSNNGHFSNNTLLINKLTDEKNAKVKASSFELSFHGVMCNCKATIGLVTMKGGMTTNSGTADLTGRSVLNRVDYIVRGNWGSVQIPELRTAGQSAGADVHADTDGPNYGDLNLTILTENGNVPVVESQFDDTIVLKIGAAY